MRYPAVAGRFYPLKKEDLVRDIEACFRHRLGPGMPGPEGSARRIVSAVSPHAGYMASGMNAAHVYKHIKEDGLPDTYVIIGPDHHGVPFDFVMCSEDYLTPMGPCKTDRDMVGALKGTVPDSANAHRLEHSVEVQVPFIQYIDPDPHIVPIIMSRQDPVTARRLGEILAKACEGRDVVIIASSDMSHYIPKQRAAALDAEIIGRIAALDPDGIFHTVRSKGISACGYGPIAAAIEASRPDSAEILKYSDSYDSLGGDPGAVVGYASAVMYRK
ncbi:MAG: AmmeMemoRadiSam system protein B [Candidatus Methanomethylophilaceae archaeon]